MHKKGFTLIELLVVIAILAVLAVAVTLILNPAELVRQGRDSTRMSDLATLNNAVSLYLADRHEIEFTGEINCTASGTSTPACDEVSDRSVDGTGWVDVEFDTMSTGSPLSRLPLDPVNDEDNFYAFGTAPSISTFEINANMESKRYSSEGDDDVESTDGGDNNDWYEVGNDPDLDIIN
jgi:prepilin-type N-terminal cleavage/methylation domain-containing protein